MDLSELIVVITGTLLFIGITVWMEFYSRRTGETGRQKKNGVICLR